MYLIMQYGSSSLTKPNYSKLLWVACSWGHVVHFDKRKFKIVAVLKTLDYFSRYVIASVLTGV